MKQPKLAISPSSKREQNRHLSAPAKETKLWMVQFQFSFQKTETEPTWFSAQAYQTDEGCFSAISDVMC